MPLRRKILFTAVLVTVSGLLAFFAAEPILRVAPIPGIGYHTTYYDKPTGGHLYPNTTKWYRSTLQSWLECTRWMEPVDLDIVVYVFCENDVSDQIRGRGTV